jgi:hypothetical protein
VCECCIYFAWICFWLMCVEKERKKETQSPKPASNPLPPLSFRPTPTSPLSLSLKHVATAGRSAQIFSFRPKLHPPTQPPFSLFLSLALADRWGPPVRCFPYLQPADTPRVAPPPRPFPAPLSSPSPLPLPPRVRLKCVGTTASPLPFPKPSLHRLHHH